MDSLQALRQIGMSDKEAQVYLALLQLGRATAYSVAVKTGLKRPTVYLILDDLARAGYAFEIPQTLKKMYAAKPPEEVFAVARERVKSAEAGLPGIQALSRKQVGRTQTLYFEGLSGLEQALQYRVGDAGLKEFVGFYAASTDAPPESLELTNQYFEDCRKRGISFRGFIPKSEFLRGFQKNSQGSGRELRPLPAKAYSSHASLDTAGDLVRIIDINGPVPQATLIENAEVAKAVRQVFEMIWEK
jgi:hypothetical protein